MVRLAEDRLLVPLLERLVPHPELREGALARTINLILPFGARVGPELVHHLIEFLLRRVVPQFRQESSDLVPVDFPVGIAVERLPDPANLYLDAGLAHGVPLPERLKAQLVILGQCHALPKFGGRFLLHIPIFVQGCLPTESLHERVELRLVNIPIPIVVHFPEDLLQGSLELGQHRYARRLGDAGVLREELDDAAPEGRGHGHADALPEVLRLFPLRQDLPRPEPRVDPRFHGFVELHEGAINEIPKEEYQGLPPLDLVRRVPAEEDHHQHEAEDVEGAITRQRPGGELERLLGRQSAHGDDEEHVEDGAADDCGEADVALVENRDEGGEELGHATARGHEGRAGHVHRDPIVLHEHL
mmetsp:Transcript_51438/g.159527  ORF Transcript_51438/g.159527 Transcript_51438/m.159527 type:complete len:359 (-) Transcript_51438:631-1707(-)